MTNKIFKATHKATLAETAFSQHEAEAEAKLQERIRREMLLQLTITPPASHRKMRLFANVLNVEHRARLMHTSVTAFKC